MTVETTPNKKVHVWTIGDRLRVARESTGLDKNSFADHVGIHRNTVTRYEENKFGEKPRLIYIKQWALATGFDDVWLLTGIAPGDPGATGDAVRNRWSTLLVAADLALSAA